ncbi:MAG: hypothetical protein HY706_05915 [Candidatus Hydrogenedentes bacterium]|nr:hypothetical protein [Candidatus Hydrogenedentota bacterium]
MVTIERPYLYPGHAVRVFDRVMQEQLALGRSLHALTKGFFLGTGIALYFEFAESPEAADCRLTYFYGGQRETADGVFGRWRVIAVLPMKLVWTTVGYFYLLKREDGYAG